jgi:hypothetical protein
MIRRRLRLTTVKLVGLRLREQGTHDSFCAYYSAAMLLCTLRPELDDEFDAVHIKKDPLFRHLPRRKSKSLDRAVADWLTTGVQFAPLARALTVACKNTTRFRALRSGCTARALASVHASIDEGLPCVLGWESRELGNHTVLVVGYDRAPSRTSRRWLRVLDPTRGQDIIEWGLLARVVTAPIDIIACTTHDGVRPDKITVHRDYEGKVMRSKFERYDPKAKTWAALVTRP